MQTKSFLAVFFVLLFSFEQGYTLECYTCAWTTCLIAKPKKTCGITEQCGSITAQYGALPITRKDCIESTKCSRNTSDTYLGIPFTYIPSCCSFDLCNSAVTQSLSVVTGIAALVALWLATFY
ncbi:sperm acrosome membrane-associated protein 4-like [Xenopus laevis]|uniref:Sperm acrosome membrane-associated protein 4-like n=2 Tax=Xenopus laevis TaxID=8355 RepID=A0A1L8F3S7_XENLA|nr:sperm acrosome membrane-associated protein 4-like [Xenopus laevis]OCT66209.1 hypothetical protein XELAEV_18042466mg [Xenopus laevis]